MAEQSLVDKLMQDIENLIDIKLTDRFAKLPLTVDTEAVSFAQFEAEKMMKLDGDEWITHGFFRTYLRWMEKYYAYHLEQDAAIIKQGITMSDLISGIYTAPDDTEYIGLPSVLDELFTRIESIEGNLDTLQQFYTTLFGTVAGLAGSTSLATHINNQALHLIPDEVSILTDITKFKISTSYVKGLFSGSNPIGYSNGVISLKLDESKFTINGEGALTLSAGVGGKGDPGTNGATYTMSFDAGTNILTLTPSIGSPMTVDLTSLKTGGAIDMSNYIKKTGDPSQTIAGALAIQGNLGIQNHVTVGGTIRATSEIEAYGA